jgi:L-alanine-DL-glutamate epimerase-like enolase superfamily enzyme
MRWQRREVNAPRAGTLSAVPLHDPLLKEDLFHRVWELDRLEALPKYVIGVLDVACWDITAKVAGLPLYLLLGGHRWEGES